MLWGGAGPKFRAPAPGAVWCGVQNFRPTPPRSEHYHQAFLGVVGHWVGESWYLHGLLRGLCCFLGPHTGANQAGHIGKNAKSRLAASGAQGTRDVTVQTWRARAPPRSLGGDFRCLGALLASGDTENSTVPSWTFALALVMSDGALRSPGVRVLASFQ